MPELPEVATSARVAAAALSGREVCEVQLTPCKLFRPPRPKEPALAPRGAQLVCDALALQSLLLGARGGAPGAMRVGKLMANALTTRDGRALTLFARLGMTGKYISATPESEMRAGTKLRLTLADLGGERPTRALEHINTRMFGHLWALCSPPLCSDEARSAAHQAHFEAEVQASGLGPDALELSERPAEWVQRLRAVAQRRGVKVALLDQRVIAGVGNIYAAEGIFTARAHPLSLIKDLSDEQLSLIAQGVREAMWGTLRRSSERDEVIYGTGRGEESPFKVYGREGLPCLRCHVPLVKHTVSGRGTVLCERCQRLL